MDEPDDPRNSPLLDFRIFRRFQCGPVTLKARGHSVVRRLHAGELRARATRVARLPVAAFVADLQIRGRTLARRGQQFHQRHVAFDRPELRCHAAPGRLRQLGLLGRRNLIQVDEPARGRNQQAGGLLPRTEIERQPADHAPRIVVVGHSPDRGLHVEFEGQIEHAVFEIFDPIEVGQRPAIRNYEFHVL